MENPVEESAFIGIDPDDTLDVNYGGGKFTLGVLPVGLWDRFSTRSMSAYLNAIRRITARLHEEGRNPEEVVHEVGEQTTTLLTEEVFKDSQYLNEMHGVQVQALKYGLRSHKGFKNKRGQEFPFETRPETIEGMTFSVATDKTLKAYHANSMLLMVLWKGLRSLHDLSDAAKKA